MRGIGHHEATLTALFRNALDRYGDRTAVESPAGALTYAALDARSDALASALVARGVAPGDPVALVMQNRLEYVVADVAVVKAGAARVPLNPLLSRDEYAYILDDVAADAVVCGPDHSEVMADLVDGHGGDTTCIAVTDGDAPGGFERYADVLADAPDAGPDRSPAPDDVAGVFYTGGTTGKPKGVVYTQACLAANVLAIPLELSLTGDDRPLFTTPLSHSAGAFLWSSLAVGATSVVRSEYDVEETLSLVEDGVTWTFMVPTMIYRLLDSPALDGADTGSLRTLVYGAAPMRPDRLREGVERLGPVFLQFYGQTEVPNLITTLGKQEHAAAVADGRDDVLGSAGRPALLTDVKVVDRSGEEVPTGETGEILAAAPYAFSRYLGRPDETARTLRDGWVHTGDLGFRDEDGFVHLVDRKTDVVITGGMNVYTQEVEPVLAEHPGVEAVAVIGVPDPEWGEAVCAIVVPTDPDAVTADDLRAVADERLADYKKPKEVRFVERLPTTPYGKLDKTTLRERYADRE